MTGQISLSKPGRWRRSEIRRFGALLAILALCVRLIWLGPEMPPVQDAAFAANFGEHALCLSAISDSNAAPGSHEQKPAQPADHTDHDRVGCCLWHATTTFALPRITRLRPIVFTEATLPRLASATRALRWRSIGPLGARAPPAAI